MVDPDPDVAVEYFLSPIVIYLLLNQRYMYFAHLFVRYVPTTSSGRDGSNEMYLNLRTYTVSLPCQWHRDTPQHARLFAWDVPNFVVSPDFRINPHITVLVAP